MINSIKSNTINAVIQNPEYQNESQSGTEFSEMISKKAKAQGETGHQRMYESTTSGESARVALIDIIQNKIREIQLKLINGETEDEYQIGSDSYTEKEWDHLILKVDKALEKDQDETIKEDEDEDDDVSWTDPKKKVG